MQTNRPNGPIMTNGHFQKCDRPGPIIGDKLLVAGYFLRIISATDHPHIGSWVQKKRKRGQLRKTESYIQPEASSPVPFIWARRFHPDETCLSDLTNVWPRQMNENIFVPPDTYVTEYSLSAPNDSSGQN